MHEGGRGTSGLMLLGLLSSLPLPPPPPPATAMQRAACMLLLLDCATKPWRRPSRRQWPSTMWVMHPHGWVQVGACILIVGWGAWVLMVGWGACVLMVGWGQRGGGGA